MASTDFVFTPEQVGERWGTSAGNVRAMLRAGTLKGFKVGTASEKAQWRVLMSEVERYEREGATND